MSELCTHCTLCMCGYAVCVHIHVDDSWTWLCVCRWDSQHDMRIYHMNGCEYRKKTTHTLCRWVLCWYGGFCHTSLEILKPFGDCKRGNLSICTLHKHQVLYLLYYMAEVSRNCSQTKWAKKPKKNPSPNQSSSLNVANSKCSQHNFAHQWRAVESDGVEVSWRKGIYSILIVGGGGLQARLFNTSNFTSEWNEVADSAVFLGLNCLGDSRGQKLKKYMSAGKEKTEWVQLSIIWNIALPGRYIKQASVPTMCAERHSHVMLCITASVRLIRAGREKQWVFTMLRYYMCQTSNKLSWENSFQMWELSNWGEKRNTNFCSWCKAFFLLTECLEEKKKEGYVQGRKILIFCHALKLCPSPILCHYDCTYRLCGIAVVLWINYMWHSQLTSWLTQEGTKKKVQSSVVCRVMD